MFVGTQIKPRDDSDYRVWAQLGVTHVCVDPPGNPHDWSLDDLRRHTEHVESFGLALDMVQLPMSRARSRRKTARTSCWPRSPSGSARSTASAA